MVALNVTKNDIKLEYFWQLVLALTSVYKILPTK